MKRLNKKTRILVVEDHPRLREFLVELLRSHGHGVVSAADGACALAEMTRCRPDVVLTDLIMPRVNGLELLRAMRGVEELRGIPVVMLTAVGSETLQEEARRAGVREVLTKPLNAPELLRLLADLVEEASRSDRRNLAVCSRWDIWPICSGVPLPLLQGVELDIDFSNLQKPSPPPASDGTGWHREILGSIDAQSLGERLCWAWEVHQAVEEAQRWQSLPQREGLRLLGRFRGDWPRREFVAPRSVFAKRHHGGPGYASPFARSRSA